MSSVLLSSSAETRADRDNAIGAAEIAQLRTEFSAQDLRDLIRSFQEEATLGLERLALANERRDGAAARRAAHALRGAAGNFGAHGLDAIALEIEAEARAEDFSRMADLILRVREEYSRVEHALERECGSDFDE